MQECFHVHELCRLKKSKLVILIYIWEPYHWCGALRSEGLEQGFVEGAVAVVVVLSRVFDVQHWHLC